jgi:hypothetical protein
MKQTSEVAQELARARVIGAEYFLVNCNRTFEKFLPFRKVALGLNRKSEIIDACRRGRMIGPEHLLTDT